MSFRLIERERIPGLYSDRRVTQHPTLDAARKAGAILANEPRGKTSRISHRLKVVVLS